MNTAKEQQQFITLLKNRSLSAATKIYYERYLGLFLEWMKRESLKVKSVQYNDLLSFLRYCKREGMSTSVINRIIHIVRQYFTLKQKQKIIRRNPVVGLRIKGSKKKVHKDLLDRPTLDKLYEDYQVYNLYDKRNKVIVGLLVHQGLTTGDLKRLRPDHVNLNEGKIYIPASPGNTIRKTMNSRTLELKASQILELKEYLEQVRPEINKQSSQYLFISDQGQASQNNIVNMSNVCSILSKKIRQYAKHYRNVKQIRASVIAEWLKEKDVRIVQYMAGHVRVTSTERYRAERLEDLQGSLDQYHPLK